MFSTAPPHRLVVSPNVTRPTKHQTTVEEPARQAPHEYISVLRPPENCPLVVDRCHAVCHPLDATHLPRSVPQQPAASSNINQRDLETRSGTQLHWLTGAVADLGTRAPAYDWLEVETHYFWVCSSTSHNSHRLPKLGQQPLASVSRGALRSNPCPLRPLIGSRTVPLEPHQRQLDSPRVGISIIDS